MPFEHTNAKGKTYYLHRRERNGKTRYVFTRAVGEGPIDDIPEGYEVRESVHGTVSLAKVEPRVITEAEEAIARGHLPPLTRMEVKGPAIVVYEMQGIHAQPVLRLTLRDADAREFEIERWRFRGDGGWSYPLDRGPVKTLAKRYFKHIGRESFFGLM